MNIDIINIKGEKVDTIATSNSISECKVSPTLLAQIVRAHLANRRSAIANTKDRSEVSGGGRKPWRQKGTGRARAGSSRSPLWTGGGVTFGPTSARYFTQKVNKKMRQTALNMALKEKVDSKSLYVVSTEKNVTRKSFLSLLIALKIDNKNILCVTTPQVDAPFQRLVRNLEGVQTIGANSLNVYDVLNNNVILFTQDSAKKITK